MPDLLNVSFKAVSAITFGAEAEPLATANAVVADVFSFPVLITKLTLSLLAARSTRRISGYIILHQVMGLSICILKGANNFFVR